MSCEGFTVVCAVRDDDEKREIERGSERNTEFTSIADAHNYDSAV